MLPSAIRQRGGSMRRFVIAAAAALVAAPAAAQQKIDFILNWVPGGDHAPYYYAKKLGWYQKEGIAPKSVTWVNIDAHAKLAALTSKTIDITTSFYNIHHIFKRELGDDMGFLAWRDVGLNPYGNSVIVNADYLQKNRPTVEKFVR